MPRPVTIYALIDPETGATRYVGATTDMERRLVGHIATRAHHSTPAVRRRWLCGLARRGLAPTIASLEVVSDGSHAEREAFWIRDLIRRGAPLLNRAGDPSMQRRWSAETRRRRARAIEDAVRGLGGPMLRPEEAAAILGVEPQEMRRRARAGAIRAYFLSSHTIRFERKDVEAARLAAAS